MQNKRSSLKYIFFVMCFWLWSGAFAQTAKTEYFYQPAAGEQSFEFRYDMNTSPGQVDLGAGDVDNKTQTSDFTLSYTYGLTEANAVGVHTFFGTKKYTFNGNENNASGMGDFHLFYKGFANIWHYGVDLGLNSEKIKINEDKNLPDNRSTGGPSLKANIGLSVPAGNGNWGGNIEYTMPFERKTDDANNTKLTGGETGKLGIFGEWNFGSGFMGGEIAFNILYDTEYKSDVATVNFIGETYPSAKFFMSYDFSAMFTGLFSASAGFHQNHDYVEGSTNEAKSFQETDFMVGARMNF